MNAITTRIAALHFLIVLLVSACSHSAHQSRHYALDLSKPHFAIAPADLATSAELATNSTPAGEHATIVVHIQLTAVKSDELQRFTREHKYQQTQLVIGSKVVAEPTIVGEISDGRLDMTFSDFNDARAVRDLLRKR